MAELSSNVLFRQAIATTTAGTSTITGTEVDTQDWDGVLFVVKFGTAASNNTIHAEQDTATGMSSAADLASTETGVGSSDEIVWIDLFKPREQFVRCMADRGTSTTIDWGIYILYRGRKGVVDNAVSGTIYGELHVSPAEGTK